VALVAWFWYGFIESSSFRSKVIRGANTDTWTRPVDARWAYCTL